MPKPSLANAVRPKKPLDSDSRRSRNNQPPSRQGRTGITVWIDDGANLQLRHLGVDEQRSLNALVEEALDLLFAARGMPRIART